MDYQWDWMFDQLNFFDNCDPELDLEEDKEFNELVLLRGFPCVKLTVHERVNCFAKYDESQFVDRFRLTKDCVRFLIEKIGDKISSDTTQYDG